MGDKSKIEWTDATWNPVTGCTKVSQGCKHCYAERIAGRMWAKQYPPNADGTPRGFTDIRLHDDRLLTPLSWRRPRMVFVNSMSDLFHESVPDDFITRVFVVMKEAHWHTFQVLTKRADRMEHFMARFMKDLNPKEWPAKNVWLGVSVEDQAAADHRIPHLLRTPAAVRFLSCEPLLGPVVLDGGFSNWDRLKTFDFEFDVIKNSRHLRGFNVLNGEFRYYRESDGEPVSDWRDESIDWVIVGGESGTGARPMHPDWARSIRDQCVADAVPFFFKQNGEWIVKSQKPESVHIGPDGFGVLSPSGPWYAGMTGWNGRDIDPDTGEAYMLRVGKKAAGRLLDGREWNEYPCTGK